MKRFELNEINNLKGGKVLVVFADETKVEGSAMVFVKEVKGEFVPTGKVGVLYSNDFHKELAYYLQ